MKIFLEARKRDCRFPTWPFIVYTMTRIANVAQYFEPFCTSSKISYQMTTLYMAATSAYKLFTNLFPIHPYFLQPLTKLLLYVKKTL